MCEEVNAIFCPGDFIEEEIKKNLRIRITADYDGWVQAKLLYKGEIIDEDTCQVITDSPTL